ncbi:MAG: carbohydrate-binding protein [Bacteroidetes bacterium]|nr:carbohydrate-binding protein [Bacteroidota bacterium]
MKTQQRLYHSILILALGLLAKTNTLAQTIKVGSGSYTQTFPGTDVAGRNGYPSGSPYLIDSLKNKPVPTNDWWSAKVKNAHCDNLFNYPLTLKTVNAGLVTSYIPWGVISDIEPITVGVTSLNHSAPYISHYSDWLITIEWKSAGKRFQTTVGMGMPILYYQKDSANEASVKINTGTATISNEKIIIENAYNGADFVVYAPKGSSWTKNGNTYTSNLNGKNYWSMVMLPQNSTRLSALADSFQRFAYVEPTKTEANFQFNEKNSTVTTDFSIQTKVHEGTDSLPLVGLLPHQWSRSNLPNQDYLSYNYSSIRGTLKMIAKSAFSVSHTFKGILPTLPYVDFLSDGFDPAKLKQKITDLEYEGLATWTDSYNEGQVMNRLIQTARIAHEMGETASVMRIHKTIKSRLENWLTHNPGEVAFLFHYNKTWSAMLGYPAGHGQDNNINDHHFHWGYFVHAAAFLEEFEPGWAKSYGEMINLLVRDAATTNRKDTLFPYLRNFNPYTGHCWANGFASFPQGNDQESTSESMQFNSSLIHWGEITQNKSIRDLGIYLYCTEQSAIEEYWLDIKQRNFAKTQQYALVSRVWGNSYDNGTFWTSDIAASYGIELYPIHGGSFYLAHDTAYATRLWKEMAKNTGILTNQVNDNLWHDVYWEFLAFTNPAKAIELYNSNPNRNLKFGISDAQTYHWLHSLNALGRLNPSITANHPLAVAFTKGNKTIYVAKNYGKDTLKITYSDGYVFVVAPHKLQTSIDNNLTAHIGSDFAQLYKGTAADIYFDSLSIQPDSVHWMMGSKRIKTAIQHPWNLRTDGLNAGNYTIYAKLFKGDIRANSNLLTLIVGEQIPYNKAAASVPGTIQSGLFDQFEGGAGQGISYIDFSPTNLGNFRTNESADVSNDAQEGAILTWIDAGEWTEYTVNVQDDGLYQCAVRYANGSAGAAGKLTIWLDSKQIGTYVGFPTTGKWETFGSVSLINLPLQQGRRILKLQFEEGGMNVGKITFTRTGALPKSLPVANAGGNVSCPTTSDSATSDGSKSKAGSLGYLNYQWSQIYGPSRITLLQPNAAKTTFKNLIKGVYKVRLTVSDSVNSDYNDIFIFVQDGGNVAPEVSLNNPTQGATFIENQRITLQASAEDLDGSIQQVTFYLNGDSVFTDFNAPYEYKFTAALGNYTAFAKAVDNTGNANQSATISFSALSITGNWVIEPVAKSLAVGPTPANLTWWSNSNADVVTRACLFDDIYQINKDGSFKNLLGSNTWLEGWQNAGKEGCGNPVAPHDGSKTGNWFIDSSNGQLVINGQGLFLGLPKATNIGELSSSSVVPNSRSYQIGLTATRLTALINYGNGFWQFQMVRSTNSQTSSTASDLRWRIFPNPATDELNIDIPARELNYRIFDISGHLMLSGTEKNIDIQPLASGIYQIEINAGGQLRSLRFVKTIR